jgi:hypothetical protein
MGLVGSGLALGLAIALVVTRLLTTFLYGVRPWDPLTLAGGAAALIVVALVACYVPGTARDGD